MKKQIVLHQMAAPRDKIRVWVGAAGYTVAPNLNWSLDGSPIAATEVRLLQSARPDSMLKNVSAQRVFTGLYEFDPSRSGPNRTVSASDGTIASADLLIRPLPRSIPDEFDAWFNILLVSCYYRPQDKSKLIGTVLSRIPRSRQPDLSIFMGDQVYLDLPTLEDFPNDTKWLAKRFEQNYAANWLDLDGYGNLLHAAPSARAPDDHEYWNNYPHTAIWIQNVWSKKGRERWTKAAMQMYEAFQHSSANEFDAAPEIDINPISLFVMDNRSFRQRDRSFTVKPAVLNQYTHWIDRVIADKRYGILITGQPLIEEAAGAGATDYALANYRDFRAIAEGISRAADARLPMVLLTGDKHWGRVLKANDRPSGSGLYEVISSPSSLVTTPVKDQWEDIKNFFAGFFGRKDPWPRHSPAADPPDFFARLALGRRYQVTGTIHKQKGNHIAVLGFRKLGPALQIRVTYYPIHARLKHSEPTTVGPFTLRHATY